jgi:hypothetical protein
MWHGSNDSGITWLGGADPVSPFLHFLDGDRIRYGVISAGPYRATEQGELHRRMLPGLTARALRQAGRPIHYFPLVGMIRKGIACVAVPQLRLARRGIKPSCSVRPL